MPETRGPRTRRCECTGGYSERQGGRPWSLLLVVLFLWSHAAGAITGEPHFSRDAERLFSRGVTAYAADDLTAARDAFLAVGELPANQRSSASLLMLGRSLQRLAAASESPSSSAQLYQAAIDAARELARIAPTSRYGADARLVAGDSFYGLKRFYEAATEYARILAGPGPVAVQVMAAERLAAIVGNHAITTGALERIKLQLGAERLREVLVFGQARWYARLGWAPQSRERYTAYVDSFGAAGRFIRLARAGADAADGTAAVVVDPDPESAAAVTDTLTVGRQPWAPEAGRENVPRMGVLAPLSGPAWESDIGRDLVAGIKLANRDMGEPFDLVVIDTGREYVDFEGEAVPIYQSEASRMVRVVAATRFLIDQAGVSAIVGPVFSTSCAAAAGIADAAGVPLIVPLAEQSGLDTLGNHVFQLSPIPEMQGRALAEYATLVLGLETLAVLSPLSDYGYAFEQAFAQTAVDNGGRIVHSDWYFPEETKDFHAQFDSLRGIGFALAPDTTASDGEAALFDSLETAILDTGLVGSWTFEELVRRRQQTSTQVDSADLFIDSIDGIAIVVETFEDAARIAPQLRFHRLQTQMLGNDLWNDPESLALMPRSESEHLRGAIFVSRRQGSETEREFVDRFRVETQRDDAGYAAAGYDAGTLVLRGWEAGQRSRVALRQYLADVRDFEGASGRISFSETRRVNAELALLTIEADGRIRPLRQGDLPDLAVASILDGDLPAETLPDSVDALPEGGLPGLDVGSP